MAAKTNRTRAAATKPKTKSNSVAFREDKKPAMRARMKQQKKSAAKTRQYNFSLKSLPSPETVANAVVMGFGLVLMFAALIAFGQLQSGEKAIFGKALGKAATGFFGQTVYIGLTLTFALGFYLTAVRYFAKAFVFNWRAVGFIGVFYFYVSWVIQRLTVTNHPFENTDFGGGLVAAAIDRFSVAAIGTIGTVVVLLFLGVIFVFLIWEKTTRLLPEGWESKLNVPRKFIRRVKELLLIPDDDNLTPESEIKLRLKPLSESENEIEEKERSFQEKLKAILKRKRDAETADETGPADGEDTSESAELNDANEISANDPRRLPKRSARKESEFTPTRPKERDDGIIRVFPYAKEVEAPPLSAPPEANDRNDEEFPLREGNPSRSGASSAAPSDRLNETGKTGEKAGKKPKARVFVAPSLERLTLDSRRRPDVTQSASNWTHPDPEIILDPVPAKTDNQQDPKFIKRSTDIIEEVLRAQNAPGKVVDVRCGPTFTQFGVQPGFIEKSGRQVRVRLNKIESLVKDLEMNLEVRQLRIEAPIPGKTFIGMQVQNPKRSTVPLREILGKGDFRKYRHGLPMSLGIDINGDVHCIDLTRMPHLLIAGETGSGKSVCLNVILANLLMYNNPDKLKLILIDPKRVELSAYAGVPHLLTPVITDTEKSGDTLQYALAEMERRNLFFRDMNTRNIQDYNQKHPDKALPYIVIVIDELASLMMTNGPEIEQSVTRLAQMARAMGIHLIVATQRPSRDVITGTIKGNLPSRIAFHVPTNVDSQVILDRPGAEHLFGQGDMLLMTVENPNLQRLQGAYVSTKEIQRLVGYWKTQSALNPAGEREIAVLSDFNRLQSMLTEKNRAQETPEPDDGLGSFNPINQTYTFREKTVENADSALGTAIRTAVKNKRVSATSLVTELEIGYNRASKILYQLEDLGIIVHQPENHANPWRVVEAGIPEEEPSAE